LDEETKKLKELYQEQNKKHIEELKKQTETFYLRKKKRKCNKIEYKLFKI